MIGSVAFTLGGGGGDNSIHQRYNAAPDSGKLSDLRKTKHVRSHMRDRWIRGRGHTPEQVEVSLK